MNELLASASPRLGLEAIYHPWLAHGVPFIAVLYLSKFFLFIKRSTVSQRMAFRGANIAAAINILLGVGMLPFLPISVDSGSRAAIFCYVLFHFLVSTAIEVIGVFSLRHDLRGHIAEPCILGNGIGYSLALMLLVRSI